MRLNMNSVQLQWPAGVLAGLGAPLNTLQLKGQVTMNLTEPTLNLLRQNGQWVVSSYAGQLHLGLRQMQSSLSTLPKLGDYLITLRPDATGKSMALKLQTQAGPLRLEGQGQWQGGRFQFGGYASADAGHEAVLSNLLNLLGQREGTRSRLKWG